MVLIFNFINIHVASWWVYLLVIIALSGYFALLFIIFKAPMHKLDPKKKGDTYEEDINNKIVI
jgi:hypothetical protein